MWRVTRISRAILCLIVPFWGLSGALAQTGEKAPSFDVASVKLSDPESQGGGVSRTPGRVSYRNWDLRRLLMEAYNLRDFQIAGPDWLIAPDQLHGSGRYVVSATFPPDTTRADMRRMLQSLLRERLSLKIHFEQRERPVYVLTVASGGLKLKPGDPQVLGQVLRGSPGHIEGERVPLSSLANLLTRQLDRAVLDMTNVEGMWDIDLTWVPNQPSEPDGNFTGPTVFTAIRKLGLELTPRKLPIEILVLDSGQRIPSEN